MPDEETPLVDEPTAEGEAPAPAEGKKKKKKKDEEEDAKRVSDDDRLKEMMGEDAFNQVKEMLATFKADIMSDYKESLREFRELIRLK